MSKQLNNLLKVVTNAQEAESQVTLDQVGLGVDMSDPCYKQKQTAVEAVEEYLLKGMLCIPVGFKEKAPSLPGWTKLKITSAADIQKHFSGQTNVGVLNGAPSNGLVDIDIDSEACKPFLKFLPKTGMISGRKSNPHSHHFFRVEEDIKTQQFKNSDGEILLEIRSTGSQTIVPPSVHPTGEAYVCESYGDPTTVAASTLIASAAKTAAAAVISMAWPEEGGRHEAALAISAALLRHGWSREDASDFIANIAKAANDPEVEDRVACVASTAERLAKGEKTTGIPTLSRCIGKENVSLITNWLKLHSTANEEAHENLVQFLNQMYAVVLFGGQTYVLREFVDHKGRNDIELYKPGELRTLHASDRVVMIDLLGRSKDVSVIDLWLKHSSRRLYLGVVFSPQGAPENYYNLFRGFSVKPESGDCSLYLAHLLDNICQGNQVYFDYLLSWMAHTIQRPEELPGIAIVFRGQQGTGKGVATEEFGKLIEPHFIALTNMEQLVGRFSGHLKDRLLVYANEAIWGGNKSAEGALKAMITDPNASVEQKFKDTVRIENFKRLMISSNEDWAVPVAKDDRRFFVLNVGNDHKEDTAYFNAIIEQMRNGGSEALMHLLMTRDLSQFDVRKPPQTPFIFDLKFLSMDTADQFVYELLRKSSEEDWETSIQKRVMHGNYLEWCKEHGKTHKHMSSTFGKSLKRLIPSVDPDKKETVGTGGSKNKRFPLYVFPALSVCRSEFELACKANESIWSM